MNRQHHRPSFLACLTLIVALGCVVSGLPGLASDPSWPATAAAQTWSAMETVAARYATATAPPAPDIPTLQPSSTALPTFTSTASPTPIPLITQRPTNTATLTPTRTPVPTATWRYSGAGGGGWDDGWDDDWDGDDGGDHPEPELPCYAASVVRDVTLPYGQMVSPQAHLTKIWRIRNSGSCAWERGVVMRTEFSSFTSAVEVPVDRRVRPGDTVDISVELVVPAGTGFVEARFLLNVARRTDIPPDEARFFRVGVVSAATPGVVYDLAANACEATWKNDKGRTLRCPGKRDDPFGSVRQVEKVRIETGAAPNRMLWTQPRIEKGGGITGVYPALLVEAGMRLRVRAGCLYQMNRCRARLEVLFQAPGGGRTELLAQNETYDGTLYEADLPLDALAGAYIPLVVQVTAIERADESAIAWVELEVYR